MTRRWWSCCGLLAIVLASPLQAGFESTHDRFKDVTSVVARSEFGTATRHTRPEMMMFGVYKGSTPPPVAERDTFILSFSFVFDDWEYLECSSVAMLVDGTPVALPRFEHDGSVGRGYVHESLRARVSGSVARQFAAATTAVELKVCNDEFKLPMSVVQDARQFVATLKLDGKQPVADVAVDPPTVLVDPPPVLDEKELSAALKIIECNLKQQKKKKTVAEAAKACGGVFTKGQLTTSASEPGIER